MEVLLDVGDSQWNIQTDGIVLNISCTEPYDDDAATFSTELTIEQLEFALEHMRRSEAQAREN